jgi:hypothetical protein
VETLAILPGVLGAPLGMERAPWRAPQPLTTLRELTGEAKPLIPLNTHDNSTMAHIPDHDQTATRGRNGCRRHLVAHGRGMVEGDHEVLVEGGLRVQERRRVAAPHDAL